MIIEIYTKNFSLNYTLEVEASHTPRVGETVTLNQEPFDIQGVQELLIHDVTYVLKNNTLTPLIRCHGSNGAINRRIILKENGWLDALD